jgi:DNA replication protein DnaC
LARQGGCGRHGADATYLTALRRLAKVAVLVLDDFGLEPLRQIGAMKALSGEG